MPASSQHPYPRSMTIGVQADGRVKPASWNVPAIGPGVSTGVTFDFDGGDVAWYIGITPITVSVIPQKGPTSGSGGVEFGFWWGRVKDAAGASVGVVLGYATAESGGAEIGVFFDTSLQFLGFQIVPQAGDEIELSVGLGYTVTVG